MIRIVLLDRRCEIWNSDDAPQSKHGSAAITHSTLPSVGDHILAPLHSMHVVEMRVFNYNDPGYQPDVTLYVRERLDDRA